MKVSGSNEYEGYPYRLDLQKSEWVVVKEAAKRRLAHRRQQVFEPFAIDEELMEWDTQQYPGVITYEEWLQSLTFLLTEYGEMTYDDMTEANSSLVTVRHFLGAQAMDMAEELASEMQIYHSVSEVDEEYIRLLGTDNES